MESIIKELNHVEEKTKQHIERWLSLFQKLSNRLRWTYKYNICLSKSYNLYLYKKEGLKLGYSEINPYGLSDRVVKQLPKLYEKARKKIIKLQKKYRKGVLKKIESLKKVNKYLTKNEHQIHQDKGSICPHCGNKVIMK